MGASYDQAMTRLAKSGDLASDTFYRVVASMTVHSAIEPLQHHRNNSTFGSNTVNQRPQTSTAHSGSCRSRAPEPAPSLSCDPYSSALYPTYEEDDDINQQSDATGYASTGLETCAFYSDVNSPKKDRNSSIKQSGNRLNGLDRKTLSGIDGTMKQMAYHMGRISSECECHFQEVPLDSMSRADKRHCRRFHRGLIGKKKAGERRKADACWKE